MVEIWINVKLKCEICNQIEAEYIKEGNGRTYQACRNCVSAALPNPFSDMARELRRGQPESNTGCVVLIIVVIVILAILYFTL